MSYKEKNLLSTEGFTTMENKKEIQIAILNGNCLVFSTRNDGRQHDEMTMDDGIADLLKIYFEIL